MSFYVLAFLVGLVAGLRAMTAPGIAGSEFVVGAWPKKTLVTRDAHHEYVNAERCCRAPRGKRAGGA